MTGVGTDILRELVVPKGTSFADLHHCLQIAFGWSDRHLHRFKVGDDLIGPVGIEGMRDESLLLIDDFKGQRICYLYDFRDRWTVKILWGEDQDGYALSCAQLTVFQGENVPEDCGGPAAYADLMKALSDPDDPRHDGLSEWIGEIRPYDADSVNLLLASYRVQGRMPEGFRFMASMNHVVYSHLLLIEEHAETVVDMNDGKVYAVCGAGEAPATDMEVIAPGTVAADPGRYAVLKAKDTVPIFNLAVMFAHKVLNLELDFSPGREDEEMKRILGVINEQGRTGEWSWFLMYSVGSLIQDWQQVNKVYFADPRYRFSSPELLFLNE